MMSSEIHEQRTEGEIQHLREVEIKEQAPTFRGNLPVDRLDGRGKDSGYADSYWQERFDVPHLAPILMQAYSNCQVTPHHKPSYMTGRCPEKMVETGEFTIRRGRIHGAACIQ